ncbi:retention module-containing protein, partial [Iodobacter sp.]|uniref:retention module-containing protein n=1 Tax=Iodobacter sp. TaxID=1915058 RepID=UPI002600B3F2
MAEQINTTQAHATIVQIDGKAYLRDASGKTVPLQKGQELNEAQTLVTDADGHVQLQMPNGQLIDIGPTRTVQIDAQMLGNATLDAATAAINDLAASTAKIAAAINNGQDLSTELEATAAGLGGAGQGEGHSFVQLLRVAEGVNPLAFNFATNFETTPNDVNPTQATIVAEQGVQAVNDAVTLEEDGQSRINVLGNDSGNNITVSSASASNGTVVINTDGTITYKPNANYNGPDQITYTITDATGAVSSATVAVTVTPVNDLPTQVDNNGNPTGTPVQIITKEDTPIAGKVNAKDPDGDTLTFAPKDQPTHGSVVVNPDGSYVYTPATDYNGKDSFTVTVNDGKGGTAIITVDVGVTPVEDPANISGTDLGTVQEDGVLITEGKLTVSDKDAGQSEMQPASIKNEFGTFAIDKDGKWSFTLDNNAKEVQALTSKDSFDKTFTVQSLDGTTHNVVVTIKGQDDIAEITPSKPGDDAGQVKEDTVLTTGGTLLVNDKDAGQSSFQAQTDTTGTYGKFSIGADGKWTYALNNSATNVQELKEGETKTETFAVKSADGTTSNVIVTIVGTNDAAIITPSKPGDDAGLVKEDTTLTTGGTLLVNDKDAGQSSFQAQTDTTGTYGKFSIGTDGKWTYALNNSAANVQELKEGETKTETFAVKSADGTTSNVTVTIVGTNDAAIITPSKPGDDAGQVKEDVTLTTGGTLLVNDKDAGQSSFQAQTDTTGTYGKFSIGTDGKWTYGLNNSATNVQELKEGETKTETFAVKSADGTTSNVTVTIVGTNDAAIITPSKPGD